MNSLLTCAFLLVGLATVSVRGGFYCTVNGDCSGNACLTGTCNTETHVCTPRADHTTCTYSSADCFEGYCILGVCTTNGTDACEQSENECTVTRCAGAAGCVTENLVNTPCALVVLLNGTEVSVNGTCLAGACHPSFVPGVDCYNDSMCDDGLRCSVDTCEIADGEIAGTCAHVFATKCCDRDFDCATSNPCEEYECDVLNRRCVKWTIPGCCTADSDCDAASWCSLGSHRCVVATPKPCLEAITCTYLDRSLDNETVICNAGFCERAAVGPV